MAAMLVAIPTTHMKFFCLISRTMYITPVTRVNICIQSIFLENLDELHYKLKSCVRRDCARSTVLAICKIIRDIELIL